MNWARLATQVCVLARCSLGGCSFVALATPMMTGICRYSPIFGKTPATKIHPPIGVALRSFIYTRLYIILYSKNGTQLMRSTRLHKTDVADNISVLLYGSLCSTRLFFASNIPNNKLSFLAKQRHNGQSFAAIFIIEMMVP